jgi:sugar/nucleoside kinase (ribokinase family)
MMPRSIEIAGFGAGAHDYFRPVGEVDDDHEPGAKKSVWTDREDRLLKALAEAGCETHVGGNVLNTLVRLACSDTLTPNVRFVSALGHDGASDAIRGELQRFGIHQDTNVSPDYLPSVSIVERREVGGDRMVKGRPRTPLDTYVSDRQIGRATADADVVIAASLKSIDLTDRVFTQAPEDAFVSYNPGSSEFNDPEALRELMLRHQPDLLALNDEELIQLLGATHDADPFELAVEANRYAKNVLCTLGKNGLLLVSGREVVREPAFKLPDHLVVDTLGAGDRAHAVTLEGLLLKKHRHDILREVARGTASVIQHVGAHGDLKPRT